MARARSLKPGFFLNEDLASCAPLARLLFQGLWIIADREGRLEYRPKRIRAVVLPYDVCDIDDLLGQLEAKGFILIYDHADDKYIQIVTFVKHQKPHPKEAPSILPSPSCLGHDKPEQNMAEPDLGDNEPGLSSLLPSPSSLLSSSPLPLPGPNMDLEFQAWYASYPRKVAVAAARRAYKTARRKATAEDLLAGIERYKGTKPTNIEWAYPASWLNGERWNDEPAPPVVSLRPPRPDPSAPPPSMEPTHRARLEAYCRSGFWPAMGGPKPGEPGCEVLPRILAEYGDRLPRDGIPQLLDPSK